MIQMILRYQLVCSACGAEVDRRTAKRIRIRRRDPTAPHMIALECDGCGNRSFHAFLIEDPEATMRKRRNQRGDNVVIIQDDADIRIISDP